MTNSLKYGQKLKRKADPHDIFIVGQSYTQGGNEFLFISKEHNMDSKLLLECVILELFEPVV